MATDDDPKTRRQTYTGRLLRAMEEAGQAAREADYASFQDWNADLFRRKGLPVPDVFKR